MTHFLNHEEFGVVFLAEELVLGDGRAQLNEDWCFLDVKHLSAFKMLLFRLHLRTTHAARWLQILANPL